ncbi:MAG: UvrD-helicase domain-containing protein [Gammaproteobacteria bacterium]
MKEYHVYGPPGTGKTRRAEQDVVRAAEKFGKDQVLVTAFTRAAAAELIDRDLDIPKRNVGTLHSICYRALDRPILAETKTAEFNELHPNFAVASAKVNVEEGKIEAGQTNGQSNLLQTYQLHRARMTPRDAWPSEAVRNFAKLWESWKKDTGYYDFTDLIQAALDTMPFAPGRPKVGIVDEAQDLTALECALVRSWGIAMEYLILIGDDDQCIFEFTGASAANMVGAALPREHKRFLTKSHRLPRRIWEYARAISARIEQRQEKEFEHNGTEGSVHTASCGDWRRPEAIADDMEARLEIGERIMVLGSCGYMLVPLIRELRRRGLPFHNPYRVTRGDWNPINRAAGSTMNRIAAFLNGAENVVPSWSVGQMVMWTDLVKAKHLLKHGGKKRLEKMNDESPARLLGYHDWLELFEEDPWGWDPCTLDWLKENALPSKLKQMEYPMTVVEKHGLQTLLDRPRIVVGTIHSVKGGEADTVYVFPDLSTQGSLRALDAESDHTMRLFYVAASRARHNLVLCRPAGPYFARLPDA